MSGAAAEFDPGLSGRDLRIGIVQARFNAYIGNQLRDGCMNELRRLGVAEDDVELVTVPGALEVPLVLKALAQSQQFDALIALGCVMRGETYHFELVCNESARGITLVQLEHSVPIANAILTVENEAQAQARVSKGMEAARVAVEMALTFDDLSD